MYLKTRKRTRFGDLIIALIIILFSAVCLIPYVSLDYVRSIQIITTVVLFSLLLVCSQWSNEVSNISIGLIGFYVMILFYWGIGYSDASRGNYFYQMTFFISIGAAIYCVRRMSNSLLYSLYFVILAIMSIHLVQNILIGEMFQGYSMEELQELGSSVISTSFSTAFLFLLSISLMFFLNTESVLFKLIHLAVIALAFYFIVFCGQRGSVVILMLISVFLIIYEKFFRKKKVKKSSRLVTLIVGVLLLVIFGDYLIDLFIKLSPSERLTERFVDLQGVFQHGVSEDSLSGRLSLEIVSIRSWLSSIVSFFFGIGDHRTDASLGMQGYVMSGIGGHSELIDSLARYGLVGFSIICYLYYHIFKYILSLFQNENIRNQVRAILFVSVLTSLTKGIFFPEIGLCLFFVLPLSSVFLNK